MFLLTGEKTSTKFKDFYQRQVHEYITSGHTKKTNEKKTSKSLDITNYLPHCEVFNVNKPGQARIVCDA